ncbi:hypothetical protein AVEN_132580-1 [Araneus ventricosus]|uniref:Uncharacterized protein n=1 Tax=Araneus ventricosus TaxID=182803 RepID=A0A4Y2RS98_ARAVE|nr:hypothetical protein AVEN_132580-1 [Araneus ventricosus]
MSLGIETPFIETRSHIDRPMNGFLSDRDEFSFGIALKCLIGDGCIRSSISGCSNAHILTLQSEFLPNLAALKETVCPVERQMRQTCIGIYPPSLLGECISACYAVEERGVSRATEYEKKIL